MRDNQPALLRGNCSKDGSDRGDAEADDEVDGEITTNKLLVQSGAKFNVSCKMDLGASNGAVKNADLKPANNATSTLAGGKA
jgi:hypothetical protein